MPMTQASFELELSGLGDLNTIQPDIQAIRNATLRHTAKSNIDIATPHLGETFREYADIFADVQLRVRLWDDGEAVGTETLWNGILTEVDTQGQSDEATLKTVGKGWYLEKDEAIVEFSNIRVWEAIEQYLDEETDFNATVTPDPGSPVVTDELAQEASTQTEWEDLLSTHLTDTDPFELSGGSLNLVQTCFPREGDDPDVNSGGNVSYNEPQFSGGFAGGIDGSGQEMEWHFTTSHEIPADDVGMHILQVAESDAQACSIILQVNGTNNDLTSLAGGETLVRGWRDLANDPYGSGGNGYTGSDIPAGADVRLRLQADGSTGTRYAWDVVALADNRFSYTFDDTVHEDFGYLDGPELYPVASLELPQVERQSQVEAARVTSTWNDTTEGQAVAASNDGGDNYLSSANSTSLDVNFSDQELFGQILVAKPTLSRYDDGAQDATPRFGYNGQSVSEFELRFDQTSIAVIDSAIYSESHLQNLKDLCDRGRFSFVIDHTADGKAIEAFPIGAEGDAVDWATKDYSRTDGSTRYANRIVARGALKTEEEKENEDDLRWESIVTDDDEIQRLQDLGLTQSEATITQVIIDPEWQSQSVVNQQAFAALEGYVEERQPSGSVDIVPTFIKPGYAYPVDDFEESDGTVPTHVLEKLTFSQSHGSARGGLEFEAPQNWVRAISPVEQDVISLKRLF